MPDLLGVSAGTRAAATVDASTTKPSTKEVTMNIIRRSAPAPLTPATEWDPFRAMREMMRWDPFQEMSPILAQEKVLFMPDVDVKETPNAYVFKADLPGMKEKDVEVSFTGNRVTMSGKREEERREEKATYFASERLYGAFTRTFTLPAGADTDHASAELKDGVLTISVPKAPSAQPRKIPVSGTAEKPQAKA
jgi:HSP20 family protein